ncbi:MAG TPA: HD-GYP domain-containing protein [Baekduia sp.]|uniref:HD-GYP domain-containing protein n=1 Tax=Baekduia sp. TaxID=2600305 RepID=UPI002D770E0C|nr:HD-GYP domain-containing protein [Baekduia sp.]HET6508170.1 HD-GYP domain-containing protein [Baekduia sp.]
MPRTNVLSARPTTHPLLNHVARHACRTATCAAVAITRCPGHGAEADHELLALAGAADALDDLVVPERHALGDGEPVVARDSAHALLTLDAPAWGALTLVRPRMRRGRALHEAVEDLAALAAEALRAAEAERRLARTLEASVGSLAALLDLRDGYTGRHSSTVVDLCEQVARRVGVTGAELGHLRIAAHLHDLGKIGVPDQILHKPGPLDDAEWSIMREHPVWGARALEAIPEFREASRAVRHHHERWDGAGYPDGLAGEAIPIGARVIAVCDAYEAMTSHRPYREALPEPLARERIVAGTGSHFDPAATWGLLDALAA